MIFMIYGIVTKTVGKINNIVIEGYLYLEDESCFDRWLLLHSCKHLYCSALGIHSKYIILDFQRSALV